MKKFQFILIILTISFSIKAQQNTFSKVFYDTMLSGIQTTSIAPAFDGGYLIAGNGTSDNIGFILRTDAQGHETANKTFSLPNSGVVFNGVITTVDSCFVLLGSSYNNITNEKEALCIKIDAAGDTLWSKAISHPGFNLNAVAGQQTDDSCFIISGYTYDINAPYSRIFAARLDVNGNLQWSDILTTGNNGQNGFSVKQTPDGGFLVIGGFTNCTPCYSNAFLIKLTSSGLIEWSKQYKLTSASFCFGYDFVNTADGYICYLSSGLMKTDFSGNILWTKSYYSLDGGNCINCPAPKLRITSDGSLILLATDSWGTGSRIIKTDLSGNPLWSSDLFLSSADVIETKNRELIIVGNGPMIGVKGPGVLCPQIGLIQMDSLGTGMECIFNSNINPVIDTLIASPVLFNVVNGAAANNFTPEINSLDIIEFNGCVDFIGGVAETGKSSGFSVFPNPAAHKVNIEAVKDFKEAILSIYNTNMQVVLQKTISQKHTELDISGLSSGMYFLNIKTNYSVDVLKLLKE